LAGNRSSNENDSLLARVNAARLAALGKIRCIPQPWPASGGQRFYRRNHSKYQFAMDRIEIERSWYKGRYEPPKTPKSQRTVGVPDEILGQLKSWIAKLPVNGPTDCVFPSAKLVTPIWPESVLRNYIRPKLRPVKLGWINFAVLRRSHSTLHKRRNSDLKIIADQQGHGMRTHLESYVQSAVGERKAEAAKLYADFTGVKNKQG
jgi:integrase